MSFGSYHVLSLLASVTSLSLVKPEINGHSPSEKPFILTNATHEGVLGLNVGREMVGRRLTMNNAQRSTIVNKHNVLRANVDAPCAAADMETLQWDDTLATKAEEYARKCVWAHDDAVNVPNLWGENMALSVTGASLEDLVQGWYDEVIDIRWNAADKTVRAAAGRQCESPDTRTGKCQITHYTTLVWSETNKVGCGWASCENVAGLQWWKTSGVMFVCKYAPGGNTEDYYGNVYAPFQVGKRAAACLARSTEAGVSGKLCAPGDTPNRCRDELGYSLFQVDVDEARYTDCKSLIKGFKKQCAAQQQVPCKDWCTDFRMAGAPQNWCSLTCNECSLPTSIGASHCAGASPTGVQVTSPEAEHRLHRVLHVKEENKAHYSIKAALIQLGATGPQRAFRSTLGVE